MGQPTDSQFSVRSRPFGGSWAVFGPAGTLHHSGWCDAAFWPRVLLAFGVAGGSVFRLGRGCAGFFWPALGLLFGGLGALGRTLKTRAVLGVRFGCCLGFVRVVWGSFGGRFLGRFWLLLGGVACCRVAAVTLQHVFVLPWLSVGWFTF